MDLECLKMEVHCRDVHNMLVNMVFREVGINLL